MEVRRRYCAWWSGEANFIAHHQIYGVVIDLVVALDGREFAEKNAMEMVAASGVGRNYREREMDEWRQGFMSIFFVNEG